MSNYNENFKLLGRLERQMDDLIGSGFFGKHVADGCRLCRAQRIHDAILVLYRLCEEKRDGECGNVIAAVAECQDTHGDIKMRNYLETIRDTPAGTYCDRNEDHTFTCASCETMKALAEAALNP